MADAIIIGFSLIFVLFYLIPILGMSVAFRILVKYLKISSFVKTLIAVVVATLIQTIFTRLTSPINIDANNIHNIMGLLSVAISFSILQLTFKR